MSANQIEQFKSEIIGTDGDQSYATVMVELHKCPCCAKFMLFNVLSKYPYNGPFPHWFKCDIETQMKRAGWVHNSQIKVDDKYICKPCALAGKADFLCALCETRKPGDEMHSFFGDPPEHLCKPCYNTVPVSQWDAKCSELEEAHQYDFE